MCRLYGLKKVRVCLARAHFVPQAGLFSEILPREQYNKAIKARTVLIVSRVHFHHKSDPPPRLNLHQLISP